MRRIVRIFALVILVLPIAAKAVDFGGIAAYPANPSLNDERTASWFVYTLTPGGSKTDSLVIENNTDQEKTLDLYPADSTPTTGDGFALKQKVETMTNVGKWIALEKILITLAAGQSLTVPVSVILPKDITPGLYAGGIMIAEHADQKENKGVNIDVRMGVRVYITVVPKILSSGNVDGLLPPNRPPWISFIIAGPIIVIAVVAGALYMSIIKKRRNNI